MKKVNLVLMVSSVFFSTAFSSVQAEGYVPFMVEAFLPTPESTPLPKVLPIASQKPAMSVVPLAKSATANTPSVAPKSVAQKKEGVKKKQKKSKKKKIHHKKSGIQSQPNEVEARNSFLFRSGMRFSFLWA